MKKYISVAIILFVLLSICSCGTKTLEEDVSINYGESIKIENEVFEKYPDLKWFSDSPDVVSVKDGIVEGLNEGTATVLASSKDKNIAKYNITVSLVPADSIQLSETQYELNEGEQIVLHYSLTPNSASDFGYVWKSSDESVATVSQDGTVVGVKNGTADIILSNDTFGISEKCQVTVFHEPTVSELVNSLPFETAAAVSACDQYVKDNFGDLSSINAVMVYKTSGTNPDYYVYVDLTRNDCYAVNSDRSSELYNMDTVRRLYPTVASNLVETAYYTVLSAVLKEGKPVDITPYKDTIIRGK